MTKDEIDSALRSWHTINKRVAETLILKHMLRMSTEHADAANQT